jgi:hypothetical protein
LVYERRLRKLVCPLNVVVITLLRLLLLLPQVLKAIAAMRGIEWSEAAATAAAAAAAASGSSDSAGVGAQQQQQQSAGDEQLL